MTNVYCQTRSHDFNDNLSENSFTCPACNSIGSLNTLGAFYGLYVKDDDDVTLVGLCKGCAPIVNEPKTNSERVRLKERLEFLIVNHDT